jgi:hypothetical protein
MHEIGRYPSGLSHRNEHRDFGMIGAGYTVIEGREMSPCSRDHVREEWTERPLLPFRLGLPFLTRKNLNGANHRFRLPQEPYADTALRFRVKIEIMFECRGGRCELHP